MRTRLEEIARRTGYSIATVSRSLNGFHWVSDRTRRTVLACAREMGCLRSGGTIAVIVPGTGLSYYQKEMAVALESGIRSAGYRTVLVPGNSVDLIREYSPRGALSLIGGIGLERLWGKKYEIPLVCINAAPRHLEGIFSVVSREEQGMRLLLEHLLSRGHHTIGMLSYGQQEKEFQNIYVFRDRKRTFQKILTENGLPDNHIIRYSWNKQEFAAALYQLLETGVSAIVTMSEGQMMKILHFLRLAGVRVPQDVSLTGWMDETDQYCDLKITGIMQNYGVLAEKAVHLMEKLLRKEPVEKDVIVDYTFVSGASTALPKKGARVFSPWRRFSMEKIPAPSGNPAAERNKNGGCPADDPE